MKHGLLIIMMLFPLVILAQEKNEAVTEVTPKQKGKITGRVMGDDGQPMEGAIVSVSVVGNNNPDAWHLINADDEGNFIVSDLAPAAYTVFAESTAFVSPAVNSENKYYHLGDTVNFTLVKGGVITGQVTNTQGEPVIAAPLAIIRVRDAEGRKVNEQGWFSRPRKTDDRGMYRVFGLRAGKYLVLAGGKRAAGWGPQNSYDTDTGSYYPAGNRDSAIEVSVSLGEEINGINIRYRSEKGYSINGKVIGGPIGNLLAFGGISIILQSHPGHSTEMSSYIMPTDPTRSFSFYGVADGEYDLVANAGGGWGVEEKDSFFSAPRRIIIKGGNVANIELHLSPTSSVEGKVELAVSPEKEVKTECKSARTSIPAELVIGLRRDTGGKDDEPKPQNEMPVDVPDEKSEFKLKYLEAGHYHPNIVLPDETWYVKSILIKAPTPKSPAEKISAMTDAGKLGINLKAGEKLKDVTITVIDGAAGISGKITGEKNQALPPRLRVHLLPADKELAEDLLRYGEVKTKADRAFAFANLAPGKYWLLLRNVEESEAEEKPAPPAAWDAKLRQQLRREAEAANNLVELKACQRVNDYVLKLK